MRPLSQFLLRNAARFGIGNSTLCINPPDDLPWRNLQTGTARIRMFTQDYADLLRLRASGAEADFGVVPEPAGAPLENILLALPREKARLQMWLQWSAGALPPQGRLWLAGENRAGIRSAEKHLARVFGETARLDNARHCVLYESSRPASEQAFKAADHLYDFQVRVADQELRIRSYPGVFSHGELDPGTQMLLETLAGGDWIGDVLDFGCGNGVIGLYLKSRNPAIRLSMLDANALALASARLTLEGSGCSAEILASDGFSEIEGTFDLVVTNPPFHRRHETRTRLSTGLLAPVRNFLNPGGQLLMVANRHLPYRSWLDDTFGGHRVLADDAQYQVLHAVQS